MEDRNSGRESYGHRLAKWERMIIDVKDVMKVLGYKNVRSVLTWCEKNNVFVLSQGNKQVVNSVEFIIAFYTPFIHHLKRTRENWKELFMGFVCGDVIGVIEDDSPCKKTFRSYIPKSEIESSFLQKLKDV